jgi:hypothetical protein
MIKETITYKTPDGDKLTEDFYFNFDKVEIIDLQVQDKRGLQAVLEAIQAAKDTKAAFDFIKDTILLAYCERAPDGKGVKKTQELRDSFRGKEAFVNLVFEFLEDPTAGAKFFDSLVPEWMKKEFEETAKKVEGMDLTMPSISGTDAPVRPPTRDHQQKKVVEKVVELPREKTASELEAEIAALKAQLERK